jgi:hypothetical protein
MTAPHAGRPTATAPRAVPPPLGAAARPDRVYLGWQFALVHPDPGPMPRRPAPPVPEQLNHGWVQAQHREQRRLSRPLRIAGVGAVVVAGAALALGVLGMLNAYLTGVVIAASLAAAVAAVRAIRRGEQELRACIEAEQQRVDKIRDVQLARLGARQEVHASQFRAWQSRQAAFERQLQWYAVSLPGEIDRVDVAGGTLAGWSAMLTMVAAPRLSAGGDVTVLDLTEGAVARDLLALARRSGVEPLVWVLPDDLPRLDLGTGLGPEAMADVLATTASASDGPGAPGGADGASGHSAAAAGDSALLERVLEALQVPDGASIAQVTAALRALAQVGDPRDDIRRGLLTPEQFDRITKLFGRAATDRVVIDRAWALESRLRRLEPLGTDPAPLRPSRLRVAWLDRRSGALGNKVLGSYLTVALTHVLRQVPSGPPWEHTLCLLGAERLPGEVIDRLCEACEFSGTGLVIGYRSLPAHAKQRLGRGNAAVAFMRLGNAEDARAACEQIGTEHRFVVSQLTDTVGTSLTDTGGDSYTSTVGTADSVAESLSVSETSGRSRGHGRSRQGAFAQFGTFTGSASRDASQSRSTADSWSLTAGINASTSWGISTSKAVGANTSLARTSQRSREFLVEQHQLQQLPPSAMIVTYAAREGRQVVLADANPAIIALRSSTLASLAEAGGRMSSAAGTAVPEAGAAAQDAAAYVGPDAADTGTFAGLGALPAAGEVSGPGSRPAPGTGAGTSPAPGSPGQPPAASPVPPGRGQPGRPIAPPNLGPPPERLDWRKPRR